MYLLEARKSEEEWVSECVLDEALSIIIIQQSCSLVYYISPGLLWNKGNLWFREICCHLCLTAACALNHIQQQQEQKHNNNMYMLDSMSVFSILLFSFNIVFSFLSSLDRFSFNGDLLFSMFQERYELYGHFAA